jgi:hypothetical protein
VVLFGRRKGLFSQRCKRTPDGSKAAGAGPPVERRELLEPVYGWFTEGLDSRDLKEAKVLLDNSGPGHETNWLRRRF